MVTKLTKTQRSIIRPRPGSADLRAGVAGCPARRKMPGNCRDHLRKVSLKAIIINFYAGNKPSIDVDNMSKPILDAMQNIVYDDDRQIVQAEIIHLKIGAAFSIAGVSKVLVTALQAGSQFVYVRIEDPVDPFPLPK